MLSDEYFDMLCFMLLGEHIDDPFPTRIVSFDLRTFRANLRALVEVCQIMDTEVERTEILVRELQATKNKQED